MKHFHRPIAAMAVLLAAVLSGCSGDNGKGDHEGSGALQAGRGEHDRDGGEHGGKGERSHGEEGEESGTELALNEVYDHVRNGARLILAYDAKSNAFKGTVENTTKKTLKKVRVEVHLSNGVELGPTTPADLKPGMKRDIKLTATQKAFDGWTAHPEIGSEEHGREGGEHGEEGRGEHDREGRGEHGGEHGGEHK